MRVGVHDQDGPVHPRQRLGGCSTSVRSERQSTPSLRAASATVPAPASTKLMYSQMARPRRHRAGPLSSALRLVRGALIFEGGRRIANPGGGAEVLVRAAPHRLHRGRHRAVLRHDDQPPKASPCGVRHHVEGRDGGQLQEHRRSGRQARGSAGQGRHEALLVEDVDPRHGLAEVLHEPWLSGSALG